MSEEQVLPLSREQITPELADLARKAIASYTEGLGHSLSATAGIYAVYTIIRERQLEAAIASLAQSEAERERLRETVTMQKELARERELHQGGLRRKALMEALRAVENERLECHYSVLADRTDTAYSRAIDDAENAIKQLLEDKSKPVATTSKRESKQDG